VCAVKEEEEEDEEAEELHMDGKMHQKSYLHSATECCNIIA
jgi:hypothetical protein